MTQPPWQSKSLLFILMKVQYDIPQLSMSIFKQTIWPPLGAGRNLYLSTSHELLSDVEHITLLASSICYTSSLTQVSITYIALIKYGKSFMSCAAMHVSYPAQMLPLSGPANLNVIYDKSTVHIQCMAIDIKWVITSFSSLLRVTHVQYQCLRM